MAQNLNLGEKMNDMCCPTILSSRRRIVLDLLKTVGDRKLVERAKVALQQRLDRTVSGLSVKISDVNNVSLVIQDKGGLIRFIGDSLVVRSHQMVVTMDRHILEALLQPLDDEPAEPVDESVLSLISRLYTNAEAPVVVDRIYAMLRGNGRAVIVRSGGMCRIDLELNSTNGHLSIMVTEGAFRLTSDGGQTTVISRDIAETLFGKF